MGLIAVLRRYPLEIGATLVVVALLACCGGLWVDAGRAEAEAEKERGYASQWKASHDALRAATDAQADAVRRLVVESAERSQRALAALQDAARLAGRFERDARDILASRPPDGVDPCVAAQAAIDEDLRKERGK